MDEGISRGPAPGAIPLRLELPSARRIRLAVRLLAVIVLVSGCRTPRPPAVGLGGATSSTTLVHDTATSAETTGPLTAQLADRYGETLAEPAAVLAADSAGATWGVLFATNRTSTLGEVGDDTTYGECRVELPRSPRGTLVLDETRNPLKRVIPASWRRPDPIPIDVSSPEQCPNADFHARLRDRVGRSPQRDVLLFVHGFNVPFEAAIARAAQLGSDLPFNGAIVAYSWPTHGRTSDYRDDEAIVADSVPAFRRFLVRLRNELPPEVRIHILVHSMGNRLVLGALEGLEVPPTKPFANLVLAAPDVGVDRFPAAAEHVTRLAERVTLYVCENDTALIASKGLHGEQRIGDALPPVIVPGVETIDATRIDTSLLGHSYFGSNPGVLADLFALLKEDRGAVDRPWLRRIGRPDGAGHWVFDRTPPQVHWTWHLEGLN